MSTPSPGPISVLPKLPILLVNGSETGVQAPCEQYLTVQVFGLPGDQVAVSVISLDGGSVVVAAGIFTPQGRFGASVLPPPPCPNEFYLRARDLTSGSDSNVVTVRTYPLPTPKP